MSGVTEVKRGALLVPQRTVQELQGQYFVYVVGPDGKVTNRPVKPGARVVRCTLAPPVRAFTPPELAVAG